MSAALAKYQPWQPSVKTLWHRKTQAALDLLIARVLNCEKVVEHAYRRLSLPHLLGSLGRSYVNLLLIGRENSWIVNARTSHRRHFVGTRQAIGLTAKAANNASWTQLRLFALRYAAPGSLVKVYCLNLEEGKSRHVAEFRKAEEAPFQLPGCSRDALNRLRLPVSIMIPIEKDKLVASSLIGWE